MKTANTYPRLSRNLKSGYAKKRVAQIERYATWTDKDIELLLSFCRKFNLTTCEPEVPLSVLVTLAFDARTPDNKAAELQQQVKNITLINQRGQ